MLQFRFLAEAKNRLFCRKNDLGSKYRILSAQKYQNDSMLREIVSRATKIRQWLHAKNNCWQKAGTSYSSALNHQECKVRHHVHERLILINIAVR